MRTIGNMVSGSCDGRNAYTKGIMIFYSIAREFAHTQSVFAQSTLDDHTMDFDDKKNGENNKRKL